MKINLITLIACGCFMALMIPALGKVKGEISDLKRELENQSRYKRVTVTGYPPLEKYTNGDPQRTASGEKVRLGRVAVCPSMLKQGWTFFRKIYLKGTGKYDGIYAINDLLNPKQRVKGKKGQFEKCKNRIDIYQHTEEEAKQIFFENAEVVLLGESS